MRFLTVAFEEHSILVPELPGEAAHDERPEIPGYNEVRRI